MYELTLSIPPQTKPILRDGHVVRLRAPADVAQECGDMVNSGQEVFAAALQYLASALIVAHNHPSGDVSPSAEDLSITRQLIEGGKILGINVLNHIIVGHNDAEDRVVSMSLRENGMVVFGK